MNALGSPRTTAFLSALALAASGCAQMISSLSSNRGDAKPSKGPAVPGTANYIAPGPYDGPLAEKYAGKVVFSSKPIDYRASDDSAVYTTYRLGDPLYIRYWSNESAHNLQPTCRQRRVSTFALVNDDPTLHSFSLVELGDKLQKTRGASSLSGELDRAFTTAVVFDPTERAPRDPVLAFNTKVIPELREGTNTLRVVSKIDCGSGDKEDPIYAEGSIEVQVAPGALRAYVAKFGPELAPARHPENAKLAPQILTAMKTVPTWHTEHLLAARVLSDEWQPIRHELTGRVIAQQVQAALVVRARDEENPEKCRVFDMLFRRDPEGGKLYYAGTGNMTAFPCSKIGDAAAPRSAARDRGK